MGVQDMYGDQLVEGPLQMQHDGVARLWANGCVSRFGLQYAC
jgi:hypothetical protein